MQKAGFDARPYVSLNQMDLRGRTAEFVNASSILQQTIGGIVAPCAFNPAPPPATLGIVYLLSPRSWRNVKQCGLLMVRSPVSINPAGFQDFLQCWPRPIEHTTQGFMSRQNRARQLRQRNGRRKKIINIRSPEDRRDGQQSIDSHFGQVIF
jgi:hypothetical protein